MDADKENRKITNEDALHVGLATKDPGAYLFSWIVIEVAKLPFKLIGATFKSSREAKGRKKREELLAAKRSEDEKNRKEVFAHRMEQRKKAYLARQEEEKRQALVESMRTKPAMVEVDSKVGETARWIWREEVAPGLIFDDYLYAWELFKTQEGRDFVESRGLSPDAVEKRLRELHQQNRMERGDSTMRLTPIVRYALYRAGSAARDRFKRDNPGQSGVVDVTIPDLLEGAVNTKNFVRELEPIWEHMRKGQKLQDSLTS